jgi:tetratricopeptide (TPR) repeat protein
MISGCVVSATALGQAASAEEIKSVAAQALFEEGRQLLQAGYVAEACRKFAESHRLEPAAGTLLNLALCHEKEGKTATAWLEYNDALALAARDDDAQRKDIARARIDALGPSLSRVMPLAPEGAPADLWIELDGVRLGSEAWATGVPVDPGKHTLRVGARGKVPVVVPLSIGYGAGHLALPLPELADAPPRVAIPAQTRALELDRDTERWRWTAQGAAFGVGALGVAAAAYFGLSAMSEWDTRNERCRPGCDEAAENAGRNASHAALMSTVSTGIALVGLSLGTYLWVTAPGDETEVRINAGGNPGRGTATLSASGRF